MSEKLTEIQRVAQATGMPEGVIQIARKSFAQMRKVLVAVMQEEIVNKLGTLETADLSNISKLQGEISGLRTAIARINEQETL